MTEEHDEDRWDAPVRTRAEPPMGGTGRRTSRSGEGMDSVILHLREQEAQRFRDDPMLRGRH